MEETKRSTYICIYKYCLYMNVEEIIKTSKKLPLEAKTLIHLALVCNKVHEVMGNALKPFDVSMEQFNVLRILRGQKGTPANLCTINDRMITKMSNTTRLVDKLIAKGYVNRYICETNRRKVNIVITENGLVALDKMDHAKTEAENAVLNNLSKKELEQLNHLLDKF